MREKYAEFAKEVLKLNPVFIVGSGSSAGAGISAMGDLAKFLVRHIDDRKFETEERKQWAFVKERLTADRMGLEEALQLAGNPLGKRLMGEIVRHTWRCISRDEQEVLPQFVSGGDPAGFVRLFRAFKHSTHHTVHIVTTNYDHLIEWSAAAMQWHVWDGFHEGPIGVMANSMDLNERMQRIYRTGRGRNYAVKTIQHLRIYKPHGSLSWFKLPNGTVKKVAGIGEGQIRSLGRAGIEPVIVTPGMGKYLETHFEPYYSVLAEMKHAIDHAKAMIFIGFGFNDIHIQGSWQRLLRNSAVPAIVLARSLSGSFRSMVERNDIANFIAIQADGAGSELISDKFQSAKIDEPALWTLKGLLSLAWGEERSDELSRSV
ncbi:SIR2 family protein [Paenibacillus sp. MSJ-34]|uniref:SIR2 family protein n=1 Tax=Paenibacillus sp. MSJ-34 TaxID=2841529 RepID=UPI001C10757A|nr:SIR2 family protein [Paenibacillus sp. MSJ-34]MBU5445378.1 SIR2 family protein [Paenibacillus sp. MSJ-34]